MSGRCACGTGGRPVFALVVTLAAASTTMLASCGEGGGARGDADAEVRRPRLSLVGTLGGADTAGYARADRPRRFVFPDDHGPHPEFRTEWWYVTGNLTGEGGREIGFQLTIFRSALAPSDPGGPSAWATNQAYMGHLALTDAETGRFDAAERFARGSLGLAGAAAEPFAVWIEGWRIASAGAASPTESPASASGVFPLSLEAHADGFGVDLVLEEGKPRVLQGVDGLSRKGPETGNASYYYAHTRMPARGSVVVAGDTLAVEGLAWLDREWSTSALSVGQVGWDWFALQLSDGWDVMIYRMRRADGSFDPFSDGVLVDPSGSRVSLAWDTDLSLEETGSWRSPHDGAVYPSGWRLRVPDRGWDLEIEPVVPDQELRLSFRYWEGAVRVRGVGEGAVPVAGRGYVELTGYAPEDRR